MAGKGTEIGRSFEELARIIDGVTHNIDYLFALIPVIHMMLVIISKMILMEF